MRFTLDTVRAMAARRRAMRHYDYSYKEWGVDRRSNLSLREFRDVYDGKWYDRTTTPDRFVAYMFACQGPDLQNILRFIVRLSLPSVL